jgi:ubiquitin-like protein Pup
MSESGRVPRSPAERLPDADLARRAVTEAAGRPLLDDVDSLLDEIDEVLEVNAEEFVRGYVQKGGE